MQDLEKLRNEIVDLGLSAEIIGTFIWIGGNTREKKEILKEKNCKWSKDKQLWYYTSTPYRKFSRKHLTLDEIRALYKNNQFVMR